MSASLSSAIVDKVEKQIRRVAKKMRCENLFDKD